MSEYYGNNDWRDYLVLRHYGVKGMRWHNHKYKSNEDGDYTYGAIPKAAGAIKLGVYGTVALSKANLRRSNQQKAQIVGKASKAAAINALRKVGLKPARKPGNKPLKRKKKVEEGGKGVKRTGYAGWYSYLKRAGKDSRKGLKNLFKINGLSAAKKRI